MRRRYLYILSALILMLSSCMKEKEFVAESPVGEDVWVTLPFGVESSGDIRIETKATLGIIPESRVQNLFLYLFDSGGNRVYGHYFDIRNLRDDEAAAKDAMFDSWWRTNSVDSSDPYGNYSDDESKRTQGGVRIRAPQLSGATAYAVANIDGSLTNISPEKLNLVKTEAELLALTIHLNQPEKGLTRSGYFTMTGYKENLKIVGGKDYIQHDPTGTGTGYTENWKLELERIDAKIEVSVRTALDYELVKTGTSGRADTLQRLKSFVPESWKVVNIPVGCSLLKNSSATDPAAAENEGYIESEPIAFDDVENQSFTYTYLDENDIEHTKTVNTDVSSFSFYIMENREPTTNPFTKHTRADFTESSVFDADGWNQTYHLRDLRKKTAGMYSATSGDMWQYAPANATYIVMTGEVQMEVQVTSEAKKQVLNAYVTYVFHLGDFNEDLNDYSIRRNTYYKYTITIKGINSIETEVRTSGSHNPATVVESNPGASGSVSLAKESVYTFDCHYGQRVFCFDAASIDVANTFWYVKTPFGKEGIPPRIAGKDLPAGYDYKWVWFKVNHVCTQDDYDTHPTLYQPTLDRNYGTVPYSHNNDPYPGDECKNYALGATNKLMNIVEFSEFIRIERAKLIPDPDYPSLLMNDPSNPSVFHDEYDEDWYDWTFRVPKVDDDEWGGGNVDGTMSESNAADRVIAERNARRLRIYVTCYVDEFYYHENPITGDDMEGTDYWKQFVNQPNRMMFILCDSKFSMDQESSATGAVVTIRQRSIQTPFNLSRTSLTRAWGTEAQDETEGHVFFYNSGEGVSTRDFSNALYITLPVNSKVNGLYNTVSNWEMLSGTSFVGGEPWSNHVDFTALNDENYVFLKSDPVNATMRWSCLMRNRDNDGDGIIDPEEVRWYMATQEQIQGLFFGNLGLSEEAQTYTRQDTRLPGKNEAPADPYFGVVDRWRKHIVTSTVGYKDGGSSGRTYPTMVKVEEGPTSQIGNYRNELNSSSTKKKMGRYSMRCVRNLGMPDPDADHIGIIDYADYIPPQLVSVSQVDPSLPVDANTVYRFDCDNINSKSLRAYIPHELESTDEFDENAKLFRYFETGPAIVITDIPGAPTSTTSVTGPSSRFSFIHDLLTSGHSPCPSGYRVPNIREACLMNLLISGATAWWNGSNKETMSCTYSANGYLYGNKNDYNSAGGDAKYENSWRITNEKITFAQGTGLAQNYIRCVRDVQPE